MSRHSRPGALSVGFSLWPWLFRQANLVEDGQGSRADCLFSCGMSRHQVEQFTASLLRRRRDQASPGHPFPRRMLWAGDSPSFLSGRRPCPRHVGRGQTLTTLSHSWMPCAGGPARSIPPGRPTRPGMSWPGAKAMRAGRVPLHSNLPLPGRVCATRGGQKLSRYVSFADRIAEELQIRQSSCPPPIAVSYRVGELAATGGRILAICADC